MLAASEAMLAASDSRLMFRSSAEIRDSSVELPELDSKSRGGYIPPGFGGDTLTLFIELTPG